MRTILSFAWLPTSTNQGWIWLTPYFKKQKLGKKYVLVPERKGYDVEHWWTIEKFITI